MYLITVYRKVHGEKDRGDRMIVFGGEEGQNCMGAAPPPTITFKGGAMRFFIKIPPYYFFCSFCEVMIQ